MLRLVSLCIGFVIGLAAAGMPSGGASAGQSLLCGTAGDELVAARAGLSREWVVQIPFDSAGWRIEHVSIGDGLVVAVSGDGGVHAVQTSPATAGSPRAGSVLWSQRVGRPGGPVQPAGIGPNLVTVGRDLDLYAFASADGRQQWHRVLGRPASGAAISSGDWVYGPLSADGIERTAVNPVAGSKREADRKGGGTNARAGRWPDSAARGLEENPLRPISIDAGGRVESSPVPYDGGVLWCTTAGTLVANVPAESEWKRMEFDLGAPLVGPLVVRGTTIFAATTNGDLARIDDAPEKDVHDLSATWNIVLPAPPDGGPLLSGETLVVSLGDEGTLAVSAATGEHLWRSCVAGRLVATTGNRVWCVDRVGRLVSLDLATGVTSEWMCLGSFTLPVTNTFSERLILASPDGLLVSLAPRRTTSALAAPAGSDAAPADAPAADGPPAPDWTPPAERGAPAPGWRPPAAEPAAAVERTET
jgi:outer membrane protein assembly factor BamB